MNASGPVDIDALIDNIRAEAVKLPETLSQPVAVQLAETPFAQLPPFVSLPALGQLPQFKAPEDPVKRFPLKDAYHVNELLLFDAEDFVNVAYRAILHREADEHGMRAYLDKLRAGESKALLLRALLDSPEGRKAGVRIAGLGSVLWSFRLHAVLSRLRLGRISYRLLNHRLRLLERRIEPLRGPFALWLANQREAIKFAESASVAAAEHAEVLRNLSTGQQVHAGGLSELGRNLQALGRNLQLLGRDLQLQRRDLLTQQGTLATLMEQGAGGKGLPPYVPNVSHASDAGGKGLPPYGSDAPNVPDAPHAFDARRAPDAVGRQSLAANTASESRITAYYAAFEDFARGSVEEIRNKLQVYLPRLESYREQSVRLPVLDVGCGRGVWLKLLAENGFNACGIDLNTVTVRECKAAGLSVERADAVEYLRALPDGSLSAITGFHIIEHLPFEGLFALFEQAWRTLADGGLILFETPNPENVLVGSHTFYHDFSHRNPITPTAIGFLARYHNFERIEIERLNPYPDEARVPGGDALTERVNGHLCGPQDFALIAYKPALARAKA